MADGRPREVRVRSAAERIVGNVLLAVDGHPGPEDERLEVAEQVVDSLTNYLALMRFEQKEDT